MSSVNILALAATGRRKGQQWLEVSGGIRGLQVWSYENVKQIAVNGVRFVTQIADSKLNVFRFG